MVVHPTLKYMQFKNLDNSDIANFYVDACSFYDTRRSDSLEMELVYDDIHALETIMIERFVDKFLSVPDVEDSNE